MRRRHHQPDPAQLPAEERSRLEHETLVAQLRRAEDEDDAQPPPVESGKRA